MYNHDSKIYDQGYDDGKVVGLLIAATSLLELGEQFITCRVLEEAKVTRDEVLKYYDEDDPLVEDLDLAHDNFPKIYPTYMG